MKMYGLFRADGELLRTIAAWSAAQAKELLVREGWALRAQPGDRVRRVS
jgi:hypothetical protein